MLEMKDLELHVSIWMRLRHQLSKTVAEGPVLCDAIDKHGRCEENV